MVTKERGGMEQVEEDFEKERVSEINVMAPKKGEQWMDLYDGLAGKKVFLGRKKFSDSALSYEQFYNMVFGPEEEHYAIAGLDMPMFNKIDLMIKELSGLDVSKEKQGQELFEQKLPNKLETDVMASRPGEAWKDFYNALAGKKFLRKLNYYDDEEAAEGEALSITDFLEIVDQTIPSKKYQDRELAAKINEFLKKIAGHKSDTDTEQI